MLEEIEPYYRSYILGPLSSSQKRLSLTYHIVIPGGELCTTGDGGAWRSRGSISPISISSGLWESVFPSWSWYIPSFLFSIVMSLQKFWGKKSTVIKSIIILDVCQSYCRWCRVLLLQNTSGACIANHMWVMWGPLAGILTYSQRMVTPW